MNKQVLVGLAMIIPSAPLSSLAADCWMAFPVHGDVQRCDCDSNSSTAPCNRNYVIRYTYKDCREATGGAPGTTEHFFHIEGTQDSIIGYVHPCDQVTDVAKYASCIIDNLQCAVVCVNPLNPLCAACFYLSSPQCRPCEIFDCVMNLTPLYPTYANNVCEPMGVACNGYRGAPKGVGGMPIPPRGSFPTTQPAPGDGDHMVQPPVPD